MLKVDVETLDRMEKQYPGIRDAIRRFDEAKLPTCQQCESVDTAQVLRGAIGRPINIAAATTKAVLVANDPQGEYFCNTCKLFFD
jgi:hypothetical protein